MARHVTSPACSITCPHLPAVLPAHTCPQCYLPTSLRKVLRAGAQHCRRVAARSAAGGCVALRAGWLPTWGATLPQTWQAAWQPKF